RLAALVVPGESAGFILEIPPFRLPSARNVLLKTGHRVVWYLREAVPLFIYGTLALFLLDKARLLDTLQAAMAPIIMDFLDLPREATTAFLIGFLRRDYGAAGLHALRDQGMLDPVQTLVSLLTMTLFVPCLAHFLMMIKERGFKAAAFMFLIITVVAITAGGALNWALRALAIPLG
ncbi:MAG: ferrous iron transport protein B, partial [Planctomycetes bacterium]|nr:ferrous iron transport protein B [Planctomycetota bacterium]